MDAARLSEPRRRLIPIESRAGSGEMSVLDFGDPGRPVDVVFVHANGFNARTYRTILAPLAAGLRIVAPDLRGHGTTPLPAHQPGRLSWRPFRDDLLGLLEALDGPPVTLAGHSMGGAVALLAAARAKERVASLALFDPVMWGKAGVALAHLPWSAALARARAPIAAAAARRRSVFESKAAALASYTGRGAFKGWPEAMVADYVADGFREREDGSVELTCRPDWEALNYSTHAHDPYAALRRYGGPAIILKGVRNSTCRIEDPDAFQRRHPNATVRVVEGGDHFFPMKQPELVREVLAEAAGS
ncbi:MAG TPA: alpha/beta hydrolase [Caulobacteraceae bacterium]|nr:alpha/beta hydrolase [Caulobacteraceae bacterium]